VQRADHHPKDSEDRFVEGGLWQARTQIRTTRFSVSRQPPRSQPPTVDCSRLPTLTPAGSSAPRCSSPRPRFPAVGSRCGVRRTWRRERRARRRAGRGGVHPLV
jgi:hypothetical protein